MRVAPFDLRLGDCREVLKTIADNSVHSIVTDPPYELGFMGKNWDASGIAYDRVVWSECLRVLKPGGHLLAFSGSRTYHRMVCAIEDAGFQVRDQIMWLYGSGFPKSHNGPWGGTALKPAHEPICVARKPLAGTVAVNVLEHGTGALNIDGCRVAPTGERLGGGDEKGKVSKPDGWARPWMTDPDHVAAHSAKVRANVDWASALGRWPANVIHDGSGEVMEAFAQYGESVSRKGTPRGSAKPGEGWGMTETGAEYDDAGTAARFFYCAKASRKDRNEGLEDPGPQFEHGATLRKVENTETKGNTHPTVKPTELMAYLCRLVTPPGGVVLDPFTGSGSTGKAAMREGFRFIGIELSPEYMDIARARISFEAARVAELAAEAARQPSLFGEAA